MGFVKFRCEVFDEPTHGDGRLTATLMFGRRQRRSAS